MLKIQTFPLPPVQTNAYLLVDTESRHAFLIDAPEAVWDEVKPILDSEGLTLDGCLLTHAHFDHVLGAAELEEASIELSLHEDERQMLERLADQLRLFGIPTTASEITVNHWLKTPCKLEILGRSVEIRQVPGHSPGNLCIYFADEALAFVGDAVFAGSVGRTDLPGGDFNTLAQAIRSEIYTLPDATVLYPGHGPTTTVAREKQGNPYVRA